MAKTDFKSVDEYIASQPAASQPVLEHVRAALRKALPEAEEMISYGIATYKLHGTAIIYFAGWKNHYSLYPISADLLEALGEDASAFEIEKATIRFPLSGPVPADLIERIAKLRATTVVSEGKKRRTAKL